MRNRYGKMVLNNPDGPEQEYSLAKTRISLGRANTNDIILTDGRVSRNHTLLECGPQGVTIVDLNSANGTRLNGVRIERARLSPGDTINLGSQQFKFLLDDPSEDSLATKIDTQLEFDQAIRDEVLPVVINETSSPSLVVYSGQKTWRFDLADMDQTMIGRSDDCGIFVDAPNVSRHHAEVQRKGDAFILKDLGSTNGTLVNHNLVKEGTRVRLKNFDEITVGKTRMMFMANRYRTDT